MGPDRGRIPVLFLLRGLILIIIILLLMMFFIPEVDAWVHGCWEGAQDRYQNISNFMKDSIYDIPIDQRRPSTSMIKFYENQDMHQLKNMIQNAKEFRGQTQAGSALSDGFHILLPKNAKWEGGLIKIGESVEQERDRRAELAKRIEQSKSVSESNKSNKIDK